MLTDLLARAQAALQSLSHAERHRRKVQRALALPLKELSPVEAADVARIGEAIHAWRTGEIPIVLAEVVDERPGIYIYPEPIGPKKPTVDELFAAFELDPLTAELPGAPAKDNPHFAEVMRTVELSAPVAADLERTGSWDRGFLAALARGDAR